MVTERIDVKGQDFYIVSSHTSPESLVLAFRKIKDTFPFTPEEIEAIKEDIKDWGKWRKYKELKKDLED